MRYWLLTLGLLLSLHANAGYVLINERLYHSDEIPTHSVRKHYAIAARAFNKCRFEEAAKEFRLIALNFNDCPEATDAWFYAGVAYYEICELDFANCSLSAYLNSSTAPQYFEEAVDYKLRIADKLAAGAKIHPIESRKLPRCVPARGLALEIYNEVITLMPTSELASEALYKKACLEWSFWYYKDAIATYQTLIKRFPKHVMAPDCYLNILNIYLALSRIEFQNPDIISFAEITLKKFQQDFPKDERMEYAYGILESINEVFACGLFNIAEFYVRTCHPSAAVIYYQMVIAKFPETRIAQRARETLNIISPDA